VVEEVRGRQVVHELPALHLPRDHGCLEEWRPDRDVIFSKSVGPLEGPVGPSFVLEARLPSVKEQVSHHEPMLFHHFHPDLVISKPLQPPVGKFVIQDPLSQGPLRWDP
jgi:hypothetical protein